MKKEQPDHEDLLKERNALQQETAFDDRKFSFIMLNLSGRRDELERKAQALIEKHGLLGALIKSRSNKQADFTQLYEGDGLKISHESKFFNFKCCFCGLVHRVEIEHIEKDVVLRFYEES